jgi:hypothetical protein
MSYSLTHVDFHQGNLLAGIDLRAQALMGVMDRANGKSARGP